MTTVYVTHDQAEAMTLGERVAVLRDGRILQCAAAQRLYGEPTNLFVAAFIGSPAMNLVEATVEGDSVCSASTACRSRPAAPSRPFEADVRACGRRASRTRRSRAGLPTISRRVDGARGARLRREHVLHGGRPTRDGRGARNGGRRRPARATEGPFAARVDRDLGTRRRPRSSSPSTPRFQFFDGQTGGAAAPSTSPSRTDGALDQAAGDPREGARADRDGHEGRRDPVGAPALRRPRGLAAHGARRARWPRARGLPGTPPRLGDVRRRAEGREGAGDHARSARTCAAAG